MGTATYGPDPMTGTPSLLIQPTVKNHDRATLTRSRFRVSVRGIQHPFYGVTP
jgi:hypothetical protein